MQNLQILFPQKMVFIVMLARLLKQTVLVCNLMYLITALPSVCMISYEQLCTKLLFYLVS